MQYTVEHDAAHNTCEVRVSGELTLAGSCEILEHLWNDPAYAGARAALWELGDGELPSFDDMLQLGAFVVREKAGRGPAILAIVSPTFSTSVLARVFRGFERLVGLDLSFFADDTDARAWIALRMKAA